MTEWRSVYAVVPDGSLAAAAALLSGFFHASLFHGLPFACVNSDDAGSFPRACSFNN